MKPSESSPDLGDERAVDAAADDAVTISRADWEELCENVRRLTSLHNASAGLPGGDRGAADEDRKRSVEREPQEPLLEGRIAELERACKSAVKERELASALAGKPLVKGAVGQLIKLLGEEFDVYEEDGAYKVSARDGRPVDEAVNRLLNTPDYAHFCMPSSRGGTAGRDLAKNPGAPRQKDAPMNLGEAIVKKWRDEGAMRNSLSASIGLRRHR